MLTDTFKVTTMTQTRFTTINDIVIHTLEMLNLTRRSKTIRHQQIQDIGIREAHSFISSHSTTLELILHTFGRTVLGEFEIHHSWLCIL